MEIVRNLYHVSLQACDYQASLAFFLETLGFEQMFEFNIGQFKEMLNMGEPSALDKEPWLTYIRVAPGQYVELFNGAINPPAFLIEGVDEREDTPFGYVAFGCDDVSRCEQKLAEKGVRVNDGHFFTEPSGLRCKLVEAKALACPQNNERLITSLAGISLRVNDLEKMAGHMERMSCPVLVRDAHESLHSVGEFGQTLRLVQSDTPVSTGENDLMAHLAITIHNVPRAVRAWAEKGLYCCYQPFAEGDRVPVSDAVKGDRGLDGCEIIWMVCPEGNKIEVMVEPGDNLQWAWERNHPY